MVKAADRRKVMELLRAQNPDPKSELNFKSSFELLVAVVLSAQATDKSVNLATAKLFAEADTPEAVAALGVDGLIPYIKTIGLYKNKAKNVVRLCEILRDEYDSRVPDDFDELVKLPGVGRKTANVVLNVAFGRPTIAVDTHIFRVSNRTGLAKGKTPDEVEDRLMKVIPEEFLQNAHHYILLHGRYVCTARNPSCEKCVISDFCSCADKKARLKALEAKA